VDLAIGKHLEVAFGHLVFRDVAEDGRLAEGAGGLKKVRFEQRVPAEEVLRDPLGRTRDLDDSDHGDLLGIGVSLHDPDGSPNRLELAARLGRHFRSREQRGEFRGHVGSGDACARDAEKDRKGPAIHVSSPGDAARVSSIRAAEFGRRCSRRSVPSVEPEQLRDIGHDLANQLVARPSRRRNMRSDDLERGSPPCAFEQEPRVATTVT
jgi:hypothetical protein